MMLHVWIAIFVISCIATGLVLLDRAGNVIMPMIGIVLGAMLSYGALSLEVSTGTGIEQNADVTLVVIGIAILSINAIYVFSDSISAVTSAATGGR